MHQATHSALFNELSSIAIQGFLKHAESPALFSTALGGAAKAVAKPVKDVSRGALSLGDNIKPAPTPQGAFSFSGKKPPPLPGKTASINDAFALAMSKLADGMMPGMPAAPAAPAAAPAYNPKAPMLSSAGVHANTPAPAAAAPAPRRVVPPPGSVAPDAGHAAQVAAALAKARSGGMGGMRMGR